MRFDLDGRGRDRLDRTQPSPFNPIKVERACPGYLARFDAIVPTSNWERVDDVAVVSCVDDHVTVIPMFGVRCCEGCERAFLFDGRRVRRAIAAPKDPPMDARWSDETKRMEWVAT